MSEGGEEEEVSQDCLELEVGPGFTEGPLHLSPFISSFSHNSGVCRQQQQQQQRGPRLLMRTREVCEKFVCVCVCVEKA